MNTSTALKTGFAIALGYFGSTACVARDCTAEEQQEVGATGADECTTYTPPVQHRGDPTTETVPYMAGGNLTINGDFRNLEIEAFPNGGSTGEIEVSWTPVVDLAEGRSDAQVEETLEQLDVTVSESGGGASINLARSGESNVAAILQVRIPDDFDGDITIEQDGDKNDGGEAELTFLANAKNLEVDLNASGDTIFVNGPELETAVVNVNGFWNIETAEFGSENFGGATLTAENGDIRARFSAIPQGNDVRVESLDGDVSVALPDGGDYTMQATSSEFSFEGGVPPDCEEATNEGGGSLTCGAGSDTLTFTLKAPEGSLVVTGWL